MTLRLEERRIPVAYAHHDRLGYLRCHDCTPEKQRAELEFATADEQAEPCHQCGRRIGAVTIETRARVVVEYVPCRIF